MDDGKEFNKWITQRNKDVEIRNAVCRIIEENERLHDLLDYVDKQMCLHASGGGGGGRPNTAKKVLDRVREVREGL